MIRKVTVFAIAADGIHVATVDMNFSTMTAIAATDTSAFPS